MRKIPFHPIKQKYYILQYIVQILFYCTAVFRTIYPSLPPTSD